MFIVYLIRNSITKENYIGFTTDLSRRIKEHNSKGRKFTTRKDGKWFIVYAEAYKSKEDASIRERKLKEHGSGKRELYKRLKNSLID